MDELRTLLRDKADEMHLDPGLPPRLRKRTRRRRIGNAVLTGVVVLGIGFVAFAGAQQLVGDGSAPGPRPAEQPADSGQTLPVWPSAGLGADVAFIDGIQEQVDLGHQPGYLSPEIVARMFAMEVMEWESADIEASVRGDDPVQVAIANPTLAGPTGDVRTILTMERWRGREDGIFVITRSGAEILDLRSPTPGQDVRGAEELTFAGALRGISQRLLALRLTMNIEGGFSFGSSVSIPSVAELTEAEGSSNLPSPGEGLEEMLLGVDSEVVPGPDGEFETTVPMPDDVPPMPAISVFVRDRTGAKIAVEAFRLGPPVPISPAGSERESPSSQPATTNDAREFISEFMKARISGTGAEAYLSREAAAQFEDDPGDVLSLYSPTSNLHYARFDILSAESADANSYEVFVSVFREVGPEPGKPHSLFLERLFLGPGTNIGGSSLPLVVRGVELTTGDEVPKDG